MPLVVPILRLAMLFLNIYDSYKTLKDPPPSARNGGRPSQRAISQRKRDMKGCLAVWIVWSCVITYERLAEAIISIFIPFYDEFKSLALLFLIMTRARGAEPIFLHIIRPLLKPYTATLDICLDFVCMIGDIVFAIATLPFQPILSWWQNSVSLNGGALESEVESPVVESDYNTPSTLRIPAGTAGVQAGADTLRVPRRGSSGQQSNGRQGGVQLGRQPQGNSVHYPRVTPDGLPNGSSSHEIWHPPASSYTQDDFPDDPNATIKSRKRPSVRDVFDVPPETEETTREREEVEEWRQYPAFPSAYPPTPLAVPPSRLPDNIASSDPPSLSDIPEDPRQEDFRESLLPPRKPLNPGFVDGLSDEKYDIGVQNNPFNDIVVDIDSGTDDEGEDAFNITLQTPLPQLRMSRSHLHAVDLQDRQTSVSSVASRSTALTTGDNKSSLRTQSSAESLSSASISLSELSPSVLGKKRPLPPTIEDHVKSRVRLLEEKALESTSHKKVPIKSATRKPRPLVPRNGPRRVRPLSPKTKILAGISSSSDEADNDSASDLISTHTKRRKVLTPPRVVNARRSVKAKVAVKAKSRDVPPAPPRTSSRLRQTPPTTMPAPPLTAHSSQSDFSSANDLPLRSGEKNTTKK